MEEFLFKLHITNGYAFKNLLNILRGETKNSSMLLSPDNIEISFVNNNNCGLHNISINPHENIEWIYNAKDDDGELLSHYPIGFNCVEFYNAIKNTGMNDSIVVFSMKGDNTIMIQPIRAASTEIGEFTLLKIDMLEMEHVSYNVETYKTSPNIKMLSKNFSHVCSEVNNVKCEYINIEGDGKHVILRGFNGVKKEVYFKTFDDLTNTNNNKKRVIANNVADLDNLISNINISENAKAGPKLNIINNNVVKVKVPISTFKSLSKIDNISPKGSMLRFYFLKKDDPIKIETVIGTIGVYQLYLKNSNV
jgi:hypothetical protein